MHCVTCKTVKNLGKPYKAYKRKDGSYYFIVRCRSCNTEMVRKYRETERGKIAINRAIKKYETKNPDRKRAWVAARAIELKQCEICGDEKTHRHHPDPLNKIEVVFLCPLHHKEIHKLKSSL